MSSKVTSNLNTTSNLECIAESEMEPYCSEEGAKHSRQDCLTGSIHSSIIYLVEISLRELLVVS